MGVTRRRDEQHLRVCLVLETDPPDWPSDARGGGSRGDGDVVKQGPLSPPAFCICSHLCLSPVLHVMPDMVHARQRGDKETKGVPCRSPQLGPRGTSLSPLSPSFRRVGWWGPYLPPSLRSLSHYCTSGRRSDGWVSPRFFPGAVLPLSIHLHLDFPSLRLTLVASGEDKSHGICRGDQ